MVDELLGFLSFNLLLAAVLMGLGWGFVLGNARLYTVQASLVNIGVTSAFLLLITALRGFESTTPDLSVGRLLGVLVAWLVFSATKMVVGYWIRRVR